MLVHPTDIAPEGQGIHEGCKGTKKNPIKEEEEPDRALECSVVEILHPFTNKRVQAFCAGSSRLMPSSAIAKNGSFTETNVDSQKNKKENTERAGSLGTLPKKQNCLSNNNNVKNSLSP